MRFNLTEFLTSMHQRDTIQHAKGKVRHGICIVLKLVSIEYQRTDAFSLEAV